MDLLHSFSQATHERIKEPSLFAGELCRESSFLLDHEQPGGSEGGWFAAGHVCCVSCIVHASKVRMKMDEDRHADYNIVLLYFFDWKNNVKHIYSKHIKQKP